MRIYPFKQSTDPTLEQEELRLVKELEDIRTMIKWNHFLDYVEDKPRRVIVIYGFIPGNMQEHFDPGNILEFPPGGVKISFSGHNHVYKRMELF